MSTPLLRPDALFIHAGRKGFSKGLCWTPLGVPVCVFCLYGTGTPKGLCQHLGVPVPVPRTVVDPLRAEKRFRVTS